MATPPLGRTAQLTAELPELASSLASYRMPYRFRSTTISGTSRMTMIRSSGFVVAHVVIDDWDRQRELAEFDPTFLSLEVELR